MNVKKSTLVLKALIVVIIIAVLFFTGKYFDLKSNLQNILQWIDELGFWAPIFFVLLYICTAGILLPVVALTLAAGILFGIIGGTSLIIFSYCLSALVLFSISRHWSRSSIAKKVEHNPKFNAIDKAVADDGWKIVAMLRFVPILNSNLLNYALGLTKISFKNYLVGTFLGILPGALMYAYVGSLMGDISNLNQQTSARSNIEWFMLIAGLLATVLISLYITIKVKKALPDKL